MFSDILIEDDFEQIFETYNKEGESQAGGIILDIIIKLFERKKETIRNLIENRTVINYYKLKKQKIKLETGYIDVLNFYKYLEKHKMEKLNIANIKLDELLDLLRAEIRLIKERITAVLQLYAGILALVIALLAIFVSVCL